MSALERLVSELFGMPGGRELGSETFVRRAARAHRVLLVRATEDANRSAAVGSCLAAIDALLRRTPCRDVCGRFLLDPNFVESLHRVANASPSLSAWHRSVADPSVARVWRTPTAENAGSLGSSLVGLLMRDDPGWCGAVSMQTDLYGRLRFPLSDWSLALWSRRDGPDAVLSQQDLVGTFTRDEGRLSLAGKGNEALLMMPRCDWRKMLVDNDERIDPCRIAWPRGEIALRLQRAKAIPAGQVRFDPVSMRHFERHAGLTGGLVATVLQAIGCHSPVIAAEFDSLIAAVRGWEMPPHDFGTLQSFSDPTLPRVMGINIAYSDNDEPQACPFCFTWFGHELGHTKSYLIETILHVLGSSLTTRHGQFTETIARYGRALPVRTLLQIPYTHLYEWVLMMDFLDGDFAALPWAIGEEPLAYGDDLQAEIEEAFDGIAREAALSETGQAVVARLHGLCAAAEARWKRVREQRLGRHD